MKYNKENIIKVVGWILLLLSNYIALKIFNDPLIILPSEGLDVVKLAIRAMAVFVMLISCSVFGVALICKK